jgi:hypothetical protein
VLCLLMTCMRAAATFALPQIQRCDGILEHMEGLLGRFQSDLGQVSDEIRTLQVRTASWAKCVAFNDQHLRQKASSWN